MRVSPFDDEPITEVALADSPLVKVVAQLRFPTVAAVETNTGIAGFQTALSERYPVMRDDRAVEFAVASNTPAPFQVSSSLVRRLFHPEDPGWNVSIAPEFVALDTIQYSSRSDFLERWVQVLAALRELSPSPRFYNRLGVRYMNRVPGEDFSRNLADYVYEEVLGVQALEKHLGETGALVAAISQANFTVDGMQLAAHFGKLPPNGVVVPGLDPVNEVSWILDTDVFIETSDTPFDLDEIAAASVDAAARAYRFFRWAVKDDFLRKRGGQL